MGSSASKPAEGTPHIFHADAPVRFSETLVTSLQESKDSDSTRARQQELQVQKRVQEELQKLQKAASEKMHAAAEKVSQEPFRPVEQKSTTNTADGASWTEKPLINRLGEFIFGNGKSDKPAFNPNLDQTTVTNEIEALRQRLAARKHVIDMDKDVAKAKDEVVACLKTHDRKPLNCWKEVEAFKAEVGRLEKAFVEKNGA